jgi:chromosome partitioning protein
MAVIVVLNRKGGSGKSTLATHIAAYAANRHLPVMLGDIDKQQSSRVWLNIRQKTTQATMPPIHHWVSGGERRLPSLPSSNQVLVLDTPGGLQGLELAKVVMMADAIVIPVCNALFDRSSAADCIKELKKLPKIISGKCALGVVGMRIDSRTGGGAEIAHWAAEQAVEYITHIRQSRLYVTCIERGLTIFDAPPDVVSFDLVQWRPILEWLKPCFDRSNGLPSSASTPMRISPQLRPASERMASNQTSHSQQTQNTQQIEVKKGFFSGLTIPEFLKK